MRFQIQCNGCQSSAWIRGTFETDTNAVDFDFDRPIEWDDTSEDVTSHHCDHSMEFTIIDEEYED